MARLETIALEKRFADVEALAGIDLRVEEGLLTSIVGPSGCGKSTLLAILAGLIAPTSGRILLDGQPAPQLLGRVGYMPQRDLLMPWRRVLDNLTVGLELRGMQRAAARRRARAELARFGLDGFEQRWPQTLSGGMRQRAALLRTFLAGRDILLLDEPFASLDALTREELQDWLLAVRGDQTIVLVTHDVSEAIYLSDRVYVLSQRPGRIELCVDVPLVRPRQRSLERTTAFAELRERLLEPLRAGARARLETV